MIDRVIQLALEANIGTNQLAEQGVYLVSITDPRVRGQLNAIPSYLDRCQRLTKASELGMLVLQAAAPLEVTAEVETRFQLLAEQFDARMNEMKRDIDQTLEVQFRRELERVFSRNGLLEQMFLQLVASDGLLAQTLTEKGQELSSLFDPKNTDSFVSRFERILMEYLSENGTLARLFSPDSKGSYADRLDGLLHEYFGPEAGKVKQLLDPDNTQSPFGKIRTELDEQQHRVNKRFERLISETKAEFSIQIGKLHGDIRELLENVKGQVAKAEEIVRAQKELEEAQKKQSYRSGNTFEERVYDFVLSFASPRGDLAVYTGTQTETSGKVGDIFYAINLDGMWEQVARIALELKNSSCTASGKNAFYMEDLKRAMDNRGCDYGITVLCLEKNCLPDGMPRFPYLQSYPGNRFVVMVDEEVRMPVALEACIHLIKHQAQARMDNKEMQVDWKRIDVAVQNAMSVLGRFRSLKSNVSGTIKSLEEIRGRIDEMEMEVREALTQAQEEVRKALVEDGHSSSEVPRACNNIN